MRWRTYALLLLLTFLPLAGLTLLRVIVEQHLLNPELQHLDYWQQELRAQASDERLFHPALFPEYANVTPESLTFDDDNGETIVDDYIDYWQNRLEHDSLTALQAQLAIARLKALGEEQPANQAVVPQALVWWLLNDELPELAHAEMEERSDEQWINWPAYKTTRHFSESERLAFYIDNDDVLETPHLCLMLADQQGQLLRDNLDLDVSEVQALTTLPLWAHKASKLRVQATPPHCALQAVPLEDGGTLWLGVPMQEHYEFFQQLNNWHYGLCSLWLLTMIFYGVMQGKSRSKQMQTLQHHLSVVAQGHFDQRIPASHSEFTPLITQLNQILEKVQRLAQQAQWMSDSMAHDLKSPITRARGQLELLLSMDKPDKHAIEAIIREHDDITHCFNALLRISQIERSQQRLTGRRFDFNDVVSTCIEVFEVSAEERQLTLSAEIQGADIQGADIQNAGFQLEGDKDQWLQAVSNLLDNAIKYTPPGGNVRVILQHKDQPPTASMNQSQQASKNSQLIPGIELTVWDSGPGIPTDEQQQVLQRFYRLHEHATIKGHGLGLSLVQAVCQHHQAQLTLNNHHGLQVSIWIPLQASD
ncbi:hypothetical protein CHH28_02400 [Bacterioplanes sanyensis]|uniref:histidine kinase n=1 Tax=Bacterioplanes sanyensis TaxID=1249553 RepID=A0A222FGM9_9GAMM|nr:HAMP domain-containing sensor histidine kinase [Bacterioplanes sanyensis]ASP37591.1 hypothetical protein CHH28_02400 [Bacterioplanes sanyensis]